MKMTTDIWEVIKELFYKCNKITLKNTSRVSYLSLFKQLGEGDESDEYDLSEEEDELKIIPNGDNTDQGGCFAAQSKINIFLLIPESCAHHHHYYCYYHGYYCR